MMALIDAHVLAAARLHGDDTTVPVLAKGRTIIGRVWTYIRDDRPFGDIAAAPNRETASNQPNTRVSPSVT